MEHYTKEKATDLCKRVGLSDKETEAIISNWFVMLEDIIDDPDVPDGYSVSEVFIQMVHCHTTDTVRARCKDRRNEDLRKLLVGALANPIEVKAPKKAEA